MELENALASGTLLLDGAMGTQLMETDLPSDIPTSCYNVKYPDTIQTIHERYIEAGAQAVLTNTFNTNRLMLKGHEEYGVRELNQAGVRLARRAAAGTDAMVIGDIGPSGGQQQLHDALYDAKRIADEARQHLYEVFKEQAVALAEAGVDAILIETMSYLQEAILATRAVAENTETYVICTMVFRTPPRSRPNDFRSLWGDSLSDIHSGLEEAGAKAIGANCGGVVEAMPRLARQMRSATSLPLVFQMNTVSDEPDEQTNEPKQPLTPVEFGQLISQVVSEGANMVGGCCGTTPDHISEARNAVNQ
ncbi:MAG: homocysteine S-methyltransferase family protein [Phycisphaerales bacterium]|nr:MAG: homocysteine S-methyltransferase family protein [Phycisphaerales bacterium]